MTTIEATLRDAVAGDGVERTLTLPPLLQGLPDTAHGGSVLALVDRLAARRGPRTVDGRYHRRVPLGVPLRIALDRADDALGCRVSDGAGMLLVDGRVAALDAPAAAKADGPARDAAPLPVSTSCFACGTDNPLGLQARLAFDAATVSATWTPRAPFRDASGSLATAALTTLLDEAAFWLGALATGESGMTTVLRVRLLADVPADAPVSVAGPRAKVRAHADDARYWDTRVSARGPDGRLLADAEITFVAVRGAARRLVAGLRATNPDDVVRRVFPAYCA
jgi:hypothetical protein